MHTRLQHGAAALHKAAGSGHTDCVIVLLAAGANKEAVENVSGVVCGDDALPLPILVYLHSRQQWQWVYKMAYLITKDTAHQCSCFL